MPHTNFSINKEFSQNLDSVFFLAFVAYVDICVLILLFDKSWPRQGVCRGRGHTRQVCGRRFSHVVFSDSSPASFGEMVDSSHQRLIT